MSECIAVSKGRLELAREMLTTTFKSHLSYGIVISRISCRQAAGEVHMYYAKKTPVYRCDCSATFTRVQHDSQSPVIVAYY